MSKTNLEKALKVFAHYPNVDTVYLTVDGRVFFEEAKADSHNQRKGCTDAPEVFLRPKAKKEAAAKAEKEAAEKAEKEAAAKAEKEAAEKAEKEAAAKADEVAGDAPAENTDAPAGDEAAAKADEEAKAEQAPAKKPARKKATTNSK